jgi:hypothetical protein
MLCVATPTLAQDAKLPPVTVGAGIRTSFTHTELDVPDTVDGSDDNFTLDSARIYINGSVTETVKVMFNTEYTGSTNDVGILDAAARLEFSPTFNIWMGRFLPPSDRANLYGPYYAHHWNVFVDGVQDGYPFISQGRANGVMYWGQFDKVKVSAGLFDGPSLVVGGAGDNVLGAGRVQVNFWDAEDGYYLNGTYYGEKDLLSIGVAGQIQGEENTAYSADFLLEKGVGMGGAFSVEAEWARYNRLGGYNGAYATNDGGFFLGSYTFPAMTGPGRFEVLGKYAHARFRDGLTFIDVDYDQKTTEVNVNYLLKQFNARLMMFFLDTRFDAVRTDFMKFGVGLQLQM